MNAPSPTDHVRPMPLGARLGSLLGCTLWTVVLGVGIAAAGAPLLGLEIGATAFGASLGLWALMVRALDEVDGRGGDVRERLFVLWGALLFSIGLMTLLAGSWLIPMALEDPAVAEGLGDVGMGALPPRPILALVMAAGALMLCLPRRGRRLDRGA